MLTLQSTTKTPTKLPHLLQLILLATAIVGYSLPWLASTSASLQPGALDLAEWLTLHPAVRANIPLMMPALLLRFTLVCTGWLLLLNLRSVAASWQQWIRGLLSIGIWFALLPPLAFFSGELGDANYQQQAVLWLLYGIVGVFLVFYDSNHKSLMVGIPIVCATCAIVGVIWGYTLVARYDIPLRVGAGGIIYVVALGLFIALNWKTR